MASAFNNSPRPKSNRHPINYPQLTSGGVLTIVGIGLATSCGGAGGGGIMQPDAGTWGTGGSHWGSGGAPSYVPPDHDASEDASTDTSVDAVVDAADAD